MLQTVGSDEIYRTREQALALEQEQSIDLRFYANVLKGRFLYFLGVFGLVSTVGLYVAAILKPIYMSEGKILVQSQEISPDILTPVATATAGERAELIQQRVLTRERLLSIADKFHLFPHASNAADILDLMRKSVQIKPLPVDLDGQLRPNSRNAVFTIGFGYEYPELAMRVANELVTLIVNGDERSRNGRTTEMVKLLAAQARDLEDKLVATQTRLLEVARQPHEAVTEISEEQKQQSALDALKTELIQKRATYSDAHPVVVALKKKISAMEKQLAQTSQVPAHHQPAPDDLEALKRQMLVLEKQLADANGKLASARLREKLDLEQQDRMQVIEAPSVPDKPEKSKKLLVVGIAFVAAAMLGLCAAVGPPLLNGSVRSREQLTSIVASPLIVCIPYITTRADIIRRRLKILFGVFGLLIIFAAWGALATAIVLHVPPDWSLLDKARVNFRAADQ